MTCGFYFNYLIRSHNVINLVTVYEALGSVRGDVFHTGAVQLIYISEILFQFTIIIK